jgi:hypothetical protein
LTGVEIGGMAIGMKQVQTPDRQRQHERCENNFAVTLAVNKSTKHK